MQRAQTQRPEPMLPGTFVKLPGGLQFAEQQSKRRSEDLAKTVQQEWRQHSYLGRLARLPSKGEGGGA